MVSLLLIAPLLITLIVCIGGAFYMMKRQSLAQAHCVQQAVRMQDRLRTVLEKLLNLNRQASALRVRRAQADQALASAVSSGNPYAIAAAKAVQLAVILQQTAHRARQEKLLAEAAAERRAGVRELHTQLRTLKTGPIDSRSYYWRALAVEAKPASSISPDFEPVPGFTIFQQHRFKFRIGLLPPFSIGEVFPNVFLKTECSASLSGKENSWNVEILAANPASNSL